MTLSLSRRGLFRGLAPSAPADGEGATQGKVAWIGAGCVEPKGVSCRRCGEACEADAIRFRPMGRGVAAALLAAERCTGCGECLSVCPTSAISLISTDRLALLQGLAAKGDPS